MLKTNENGLSLKDVLLAMLFMSFSIVLVVCVATGTSHLTSCNTVAFEDISHVVERQPATEPFNAEDIRYLVFIERPNDTPKVIVVDFSKLMWFYGLGDEMLGGNSKISRSALFTESQLQSLYDTIDLARIYEWDSGIIAEPSADTTLGTWEVGIQTFDGEVYSYNGDFADMPAGLHELIVELYFIVYM